MKKKIIYVFMGLLLSSSYLLAQLPESYQIPDDYITSRKDQKINGPCWAFAAITCIESRLIKLGFESNVLDLSEQNIINCNPLKVKKDEVISSNLLGGGNGRTASYCLLSNGVISESKDPYNLEYHDCQDVPSNYRILDVVESKYDINKIKEIIFTYQSPVCIKFKNGTQNHVISIVGWNDKKQCWKIKDSDFQWYENENFFKWLEYFNLDYLNELPYKIDDWMFGFIKTPIVYDNFYFWEKVIPNNSNYSTLVYDRIGYGQFIDDLGKTIKFVGKNSEGQNIIQTGTLSTGSGYGLVKYNVSEISRLKYISSWILNPGTISIEIYSDFNTTTNELKNLLYQDKDLKVEYRGFKSFELRKDIIISKNSDIFIKLFYKADNIESAAIPFEPESGEMPTNNLSFVWETIPVENKSWFSIDGDDWISMGKNTSYPYNLCIRAIVEKVNTKADFTSNRTCGNVPLIVDFSDASPSYYENGTYEWDFGDGNKSTEKNPTNTYIYPGFYTVKMKVSNTNGNGEVTKANYIGVNQSGSPSLMHYEYFLDTDPGLSATESSRNIYEIDAPFSFADLDLVLKFEKHPEQLTTGLHRLYMRFKDSNGKWSVPQMRMVYIYDDQPIGQDWVTDAEYFFDTDPGFGNGGKVDDFSSGREQALSVANEPTGLHRMYVRAKNYTNNWGIPQMRMVYIMDEKPESKIMDVEYFVDDDPGKGLGKTFPLIPAADVEINDRASLFDVNIGPHKLFARAKNSLGEWGIPVSADITVDNTIVNPELISPVKGDEVLTSNIVFKWENIGATRYELWVDDDKQFNSKEVSPINIPEINNLKADFYDLCAGWLTEGKQYWKIKAYFYDGQILESVVDSFMYKPPIASKPIWKPIYRAYKPEDADHFYCTSKTHLDGAKNSGYNFERVEGYLSVNPFTILDPTDQMKTVFRLYKKGEESVQKANRHYYTSSLKEKNDSIAGGWDYEGILGYTFSKYHDGLTRMHELELFTSSPEIVKDHFFTTSEFERKNAVASYNYTYKRNAFYVSIDGDVPQLSWFSGQPSAAKGVNPANGNLKSSSITSFSIPGLGFPLEFSHFYNSLAVGFMSVNAPLGPGWSHPYNSYLYLTQNVIYHVGADGSVISYPLPNLGSTVNSKINGVYSELKLNIDGTYQLKTKNQIISRFEKFYPTDSVFYLRQISDRNGNNTSLFYQGVGKLARVTSAEGRLLQFEYYSEPEKSHLIKSVADPMGRKVNYEYDRNNNMVKYTNANDNYYTYSYDTEEPYNHLLTKITFPKGNYLKMTYSDRKVINQTFGDDDTRVTTNFKYSDNKAEIVNPGEIVTYCYTQPTSSNLLPKISKITKPSNKSIDFSYLSEDSPLLSQVQSADGAITKYTYDPANGNIIKIEEPYDVVHNLFYDAKNDLITYTNPNGFTTHYSYDAKGNLLSIQTPRNSNNYTYNSKGKLSVFEDPLGLKTSYSYNANGDLISATDNLGNITQNNYDAASRLIKVTDPKGNVTEYVYDNEDKVLSTKDANSKTTQYKYDKNGNVVEIVNAKGNSDLFQYNAFDKLASKKNPLGREKTFEYDEKSELKKFTKPDSKFFEYQNYPVFNVSSSKFDNSEINYFYNESGSLIGVIDNLNNFEAINYDLLGRMVSYTDRFNKKIQYEYDKNNNLKKLIYPGDKVVNYSYYNDDLLYQVTDWLNNTTTYEYNLNGSLKKVTLPNGTVSDYLYDNAGRIKSFSNKKSSGTLINSYTYEYDNLSNITKETKGEPLEREFPNAGTTNYTYDIANQIATEASNTFTHDLNGNLIRKTSTTQPYKFTFDIFDRVTKFEGSEEISYVYDNLNNRIERTKGTQTRRYLQNLNGSMPSILMETDVSGNPLSYYIYGNGLLYRIKNDEVSYFHYDLRGSTIAMTDESENVTHKYLYEEFGKLLNSEEPLNDFNPFKFVGKYGVIDEGDGIFNMRARFYDSQLGRFTSEDPIKAPNLYWYADGNPVIKTDPTGRNAILGFAVIGGLIILGVWVAYDTLKNARKVIHDPVAPEVEDAWDNSVRTINSQIDQ